MEGPLAAWSWPGVPLKPLGPMAARGGLLLAAAEQSRDRLLLSPEVSSEMLSPGGGSEPLLRPGPWLSALAVCPVSPCPGGPALLPPQPLLGAAAWAPPAPAALGMDGATQLELPPMGSFPPGNTVSLPDNSLGCRAMGVQFLRVSLFPLCRPMHPEHLKLAVSIASAAVPTTLLRGFCDCSQGREAGQQAPQGSNFQGSSHRSGTLPSQPCGHPPWCDGDCLMHPPPPSLSPPPSLLS